MGKKKTLAVVGDTVQTSRPAEPSLTKAAKELLRKWKTEEGRMQRLARWHIRYRQYAEASKIVLWAERYRAAGDAMVIVLRGGT